MIFKQLSGCSAAVTTEDSDDLLALRRVITKGDRVASETTRVVRRDAEYSRPGGARRVRIRIALDVERASLDYQLDRLRIRGVIAESDSERVPGGSYHSIVVKPGDRLALTKESWSELQWDMLRSSRSGAGFALAAVDTDECGTGRLAGTRLRAIPVIRSGYSGKRYRSTFKAERFFEEIENALLSLARKGDSIVLFGPGPTKEKLAKYLGRSRLAAGREIQVAEGVDTGGEDGLYAFTKSDSMRKAMPGSKLARVSSIIDEIMVLAGRKSSRFTVGMAETAEASRLGAVSSMIFSERILREASEDTVIKLLNAAQAGGAETYGVDSTTEAGLQVDGLGGVVSLLRFSAR